MKRARIPLLLLAVPLTLAPPAARAMTGGLDIQPRRAAVTIGKKLELTALTADTGRLDPATARLEYQGSASRPRAFGYPGATPAISALGDRNGIVWVLDSRRYCTPGSQGCGPAVLRAYDARTLREIWKSPLAGANAAGNAVKFTVPTIADGRVYIGTRGNNTGGVHGSTPVSGELDVYGLEPRRAGRARQVMARLGALDSLRQARASQLAKTQRTSHPVAMP